jgi:hypothetical protein
LSSRGLAPFAYTVFAAALVIALCVTLRRTVPALALALIGFVAARVAVGFLRPKSRQFIHGRKREAASGP